MLQDLQSAVAAAGDDLRDLCRDLVAAKRGRSDQALHPSSGIALPPRPPRPLERRRVRADQHQRGQGGPRLRLSSQRTTMPTPWSPCLGSGPACSPTRSNRRSGNRSGRIPDCSSRESIQRRALAEPLHGGKSGRPRPRRSAVPGGGRGVRPFSRRAVLERVRPVTESGRAKRKGASFKSRLQFRGGWGRRPEGDAPRSEASALGARWLSPARPQPPSSCHLGSC